VGAATLTCDSCHARLPDVALNTPDLVACPSCAGKIRFLVFPAFSRALTPAQSGERIVVDGESSCFYHAGKRAAVACEGCGRFLCALCDIEFDQKHLCPKCLESAKAKGTNEKLEVERYRYDLLGFNLSVVGFIMLACMPYFVPFMAIASIYICFRYWNAPLSLLSNSRAYLIASAALGLILLVVSSIYLSFFIWAIFSI